jgi:hypothetical protein
LLSCHGDHGRFGLAAEPVATDGAKDQHDRNRQKKDEGSELDSTDRECGLHVSYLNGCLAKTAQA